MTPNGQNVFVSTNTNLIKQFSVSSGKCLKEHIPVTDHFSMLNGMVATPDNEYLFIISQMGDLIR